MKEKTTAILAKFYDWLAVPPKMRNSFITYMFVFLLLMFFILAIDHTMFFPSIIEGKPAPKTIRAPRHVSFIDEIKTEELRALEIEKVSPVLTPIENAEQQTMIRYEEFMDTLELFYNELVLLPPSSPPTELIASYFPGELQFEPTILLQLKSFQPFQFERIRNVSRQLLFNASQQNITSQNIHLIRTDLKSKVDFFPDSPMAQQIMNLILQKSILVNAIEDEKLTKQRRETASKAIQPVKRTFQKGQKIIDEGELVTSDHLIILKHISSNIHKNRIHYFFGSLLFAILTTAICLVFLRLENIHIFNEPEQYALLGVLCLLAVALAKIAYITGVTLDNSYLPILLSPLPAVAVLMTMLLNPRVAFFHRVMISILAFTVSEANTKFVVVSLIGSTIAVLSCRLATSSGGVRGLIGASGLKIGLTSYISTFGFLLLDAETPVASSLSSIALVSFFGFFNGILSAVIANGLLPYVESLFSLATSSRLLELTDLSQPLLKKLANEAPGTYQHSVAVASLAEAAATAVNADPLLTKISAYFHDIGKLKRPSYFSENQSDENIHDTISPFMSSLILVSHVRDSIDIGREYGLPEKVLSIMSQHHGTTLISYFFDEAKKRKDSEEVSEEKFRYPGPKPQTKEAAIIMLADSVEAAARTLKQYTHNKIEALVQKIVEYKLNDENQLDECDLTLKDIEKIVQTFVKTIISMYHARIDYPGKLSNQAEGTSDGNINQ